MNYNCHIHNLEIQCPYCDKHCADDDYIVAQDLDERIEFECESCGKKFWAESCIVYNTYSDCKLNDEEHVFENNSEKHPEYYYCENCQEHEVRLQND